MKLSKEQNEWLYKKYGITDKTFSGLNDSEKDKLFYSVFEDEAFADDEGENYDLISSILDEFCKETKE